MWVSVGDRVSCFIVLKVEIVFTRDSTMAYWVQVSGLLFDGWAWGRICRLCPVI